MTAGLLAGAVVVAGLLLRARLDPDHLRRMRVGLGSWSPAAVAIALAFVALVGLAGPRRTPDVTELQRLVEQGEASIGRQPGASRTVALLGVDDVRSAVGGRFEREPERVTDLLHPPAGDLVGLRRAVDGADSDLLVVGDVPGIPAGFSPSDDWCPVGTTRHEAVYVRCDASTPSG